MAHGQAFPGSNISGLTTNDRASHIRHFIQTVVSGTSRHGRNFSFDWHWLHM
jgi:hypothetical protein